MDGHCPVLMPYAGRVVDHNAARGINKAQLLPLKPLSASEVARHKDWPTYRLSAEFQSAKFTLLGRLQDSSQDPELYVPALEGGSAPVESEGSGGEGAPVESTAAVEDDDATESWGFMLHKRGGGSSMMGSSGEDSSSMMGRTQELAVTAAWGRAEPGVGWAALHAAVSSTSVIESSPSSATSPPPPSSGPSLFVLLAPGRRSPSTLPPDRSSDLLSGARQAWRRLVIPWGI